MKYILLNDLIKNDNYKRYDFVTKSFLLLIENEKLNQYYNGLNMKLLGNIISESQNISDIENYIKFYE